MRFLFTTHPGFGHFHPMVPIAHEVQNLGHQVLFASARNFLPVIEHCGLAGTPAGLDWNESRLEETIPDIRAVPVQDRMLWLSKNVFLDRAPKALFPDLMRLVDEWHPDVIVSNRFEIAGELVAEKRGLPFVGITLSLKFPKQVDIDFYGGEIQALRREFGLPEDPGLLKMGEWLELSLMPPTWAMEGYTPLPIECFLQFQPHDQSGDERVPDWVAHLPKRPTIYASLGTVFNRFPRIFRMIIEAVEPMDANLILTVGRDTDPQTLAPIPGNVRVERYIPQSALMPFVDLVINHGGYNSAMTVLNCGIPLVLLPLSADQPFVAEVCRKHGVSVPLAPEAARTDMPDMPPIVDVDKISSAAIAGMIREALTNPKYRENARALAKVMAALPDAKHGAALIERLGRERRPIILHP